MEDGDEEFDPLKIVKAMRSNPKEYFELCQDGGLCKSLQPIFRAGWDIKGAANEFRLEDEASITDEAFFLLVLENNVSRWQKIYKLRHELASLKETSDKAMCREAINQLFENNKVPKAKWTNHHNTQRNQGWDVQGIERYIALKALVRKDQQANRKAFNQWVCDYYIARHQEQIEQNEKATQKNNGKTVK